MTKKTIYSKVIGLAVATLAFVACTDAWDDHYDGSATGVSSGTIWQAIENNSDLSNFKRVAEACGYDKSLKSSQVFTVFAPTNASLTDAQTESLIARYNKEKLQGIEDKDNSVVLEFLQNHIALYNHSVSSASKDTITMMNGKYQELTGSGIANANFLQSEDQLNTLYSNGLLFPVDQVVKFVPNVFEYLRTEGEELDSIRNFMYSGDPLYSDSKWQLYYKKFMASKSVEGGIDSLGRTVYLDSISEQTSKLFNYIGLINKEDSTYWMVAPTNNIWKNLINEYQNYFVYDQSVDKILNVGNRDSLNYVNSRMAIVAGTVFSRSANKAVFNGSSAATDSLMSTNAVYNYELRRYYWGNDSLHYYQYYDPRGAKGVLSGTSEVACSNGKLLKASQWNFDPLETFKQTIIIEAEAGSAIREVSKMQLNEETKDSVPTISAIPKTLNSTYSDNTANPFYNKVSNNKYIEFSPQHETNHSVTFNITGVLSNVGYDIYLVTVPALAETKNLSDYQRRPTMLTTSLYYNDEDGQGVNKGTGIMLQERQKTDPNSLCFLKLAENYKFPTANYGLVEDNSRITLRVDTDVKSKENRMDTGTFNRVMRIDCVILKPHVD